MQNFNWQLDNFALGMHTEPAKTQGGERYAAEIQNMRIDSDGWLRERSEIMAVGSPNAQNITGIAATPKHVFVLRADGKLYIRDRDDLDTETEITGVSDLDGRISVVDFNTYVIVVSEGEDQGYWIDLREGESSYRDAFKLGLVPPDFGEGRHIENRYAEATVLRTLPPSRRGSGPRVEAEGVDVSPLQNNTRYFYRFTYIRKDADLFDEMESNPSEPYRVDISATTTNSQTTIIDDYEIGTGGTNAGITHVSGDVYNVGVPQSTVGSNQVRVGDNVTKDNMTFGEVLSVSFDSHQTYNPNVRTWTYQIELAGLADGDVIDIVRPFDTSDRGFAVRLVSLVHSNDAQVSGMNVYRSNGVNLDESESDVIAYRLVGFVESGVTELRDNVVEVASESNGEPIFYDDLDYWVDQMLLREDNNRLPSEVKSIHKYNDLVFAPAGDRMIYSDIRDGSLAPWAYPAVNEIRTSKQITFCAELREVLLFGGRGRLSRLTGTDEYNFNIDTLSHRGPLDGYSWNRLTDVLAYIGEGGFFVTDASSVKPLSDPTLNRIFKDKKLLTGSVVFLQDGDILYDFKTPDGRYQYKLEDGAWARWTGINIVQAATIIEKVSDVDQATLVLIADGTGQLKELNWNSIEGADDADWHWESNIISGLREGVANKFKRFRELEFTGQADSDVTLEVFSADDLDTALSTVEFDSRDSLRPVRIPINRKMRRMVFRVSGTGTVKLQGLRLEMQV